MALTSQIRYAFAANNTATDGSGKDGLAFGDITAKYLVNGGTLQSLTTETISTLGTYAAPTSSAHIRIKELAAAEPTKGIYEIHFHDTQLATGSRLWLFLSASGAKFQPLEIDLTNIPGRLPAELTAGGNIKADAVAINAVATTSVTNINAHVGTSAANTAQTGDSYAKVNDGTIGLAAIKGYVDDIGVAGAGLTALGDTRLANLDATVSSRLATSGYTAPPSAAANASQVRTELTTELGRIDAAISSRMATFTYTAPDNTNIGNIYAIVNSGSYGNSALLTAINTRLASSSYVAPDNTNIGNIYAIVNSGTYGNAALLAAIATRMATFTYTAPDNTNIGNIYAIVNSGTYGNAALKTLIEAIDGGGGGTVTIDTGTIASVIAQDKIVVTGIPGDFDHTYEGCSLLIYSNDESHYAICSILTSLDSSGNVELTLEYEIPFELEGGEVVKLLQPGFSKLDRDNLASILTEAFQQFFSANTGQKTIDDLTTPKTINISVDD